MLVLVKRLIGDAKKAFLVIKEMEQRTLGLWQSKIIHPHPFDEFEQNLEVEKVSETEGGGNKKGRDKGVKEEMKGK